MQLQGGRGPLATLHKTSEADVQAFRRCGFPLSKSGSPASPRAGELLRYNMRAFSFVPSAWLGTSYPGHPGATSAQAL